MIFQADSPARRAVIVRYFNRVIKAPVVHTEVSTLGGVDRASVIIKVSLDPRSQWANGIFHNSRYFMVSLDRNGTIEQFAGSHHLRAKKLRKTRAAGLVEAAAKINRYIGQVK